MANTMDKMRELSAKWRSGVLSAQEAMIELAVILLSQRDSRAAGDMVLVPKNMTDAMIEAALGHDDVEDAWDAILAASAERTEPAEGREACPRDCGCVVHCRREQLQAITTPPAGDGARVTDVMVREALAHCPHDLPPPARWEWIADKINAYMTDPSQMDRDDAESDARVAAFFAARETSNGARVTELLRDIDDVMREFDDDAVCDHAVGVCWCNYREVRRRIKAALAARDAQGDSNE